MRNFLILLFFILPFMSQGQTDSLSVVDSTEDPLKEEINFISYLNDRGAHRDALLAIKAFRKQFPQVTGGTSDTLNFFTAWSLYQLKQSDSSLIFFDQIPAVSPLSDKAFFYGILNRIYAGRYSESVLKLSAYQKENFLPLRNFQLSAIALLQKDLVTFDSLAKNFDGKHYAFSEEQSSLIKYADTLRNYPRKSAFLAGFMSALVPGSGKIYTGKTGQGVAAFLEIAALGGATAEYYFRSGPRSAGFIIFGSLFSLFYIGNIWGSALSVHVNRNDFYQRIDNNIMVDLHIPLRRIFQ